jgi:hypothetical protein
MLIFISPQRFAAREVSAVGGQCEKSSPGAVLLGL